MTFVLLLALQESRELIETVERGYERVRVLLGVNALRVGTPEASTLLDKALAKLAGYAKALRR